MLSSCPAPALGREELEVDVATPQEDDLTVTHRDGTRSPEAEVAGVVTLRRLWSEAIEGNVGEAQPGHYAATRSDSISTIRLANRWH